ncbi:MAG: PriCT-2 domain-containing protein [Chloroflexota bacterium]|nr:PriCT-2 domain-containing protein [Chloroflexota bacterium]
MLAPIEPARVHSPPAPSAELHKHWRTVVRILAARGAGFVLISAGKKPQDKGWQRHPVDEAAALAHLARGLNVGLATGAGSPLRLYAFDMDHDAMRGYDCAALEGSLTIARENAPDKAKFIFACPDELPGRKDTLRIDKKTGQVRGSGTELLALSSTGGCQNCVIAGMHASGAPIRWTGHTIAVLDAAVVAELWRAWTGQELFRTYVPRPSSAPPPALAVVADALRRVDPWSLDYDQWISVLAALKHDYGDDALDLAVHWGQGRPGEVEGKWATFGDHPRPSTVRTIYRLALAAGWQPPRQPEPGRTARPKRRSPPPRRASSGRNGSLLRRLTHQVVRFMHGG